jgi:formylglycine-generating enzyme required for sulfatase activity
VTEAVRKEIAGTQVERIGIPLFHSSARPEREGEGGPWRIPEGHDPRNAAGGVCQLAAIEYAHWLSEKAAREGNPWRYRIPTDLEWERAARGEDRRIFVWGNYRVWSFAWSRPGITRGFPGPPGVTPADESVFGVRDLIGSQSEHTTGRPDPYRPAYTAYRGGSWNQTDEAAYFHIASRNGILPESPLAHSGIRLVAEMAP